MRKNFLPNNTPKYLNENADTIIITLNLILQSTIFFLPSASNMVIDFCREYSS